MFLFVICCFVIDLVDFFSKKDGATNRPIYLFIITSRFLFFVLLYSFGYNDTDYLNLYLVVFIVLNFLVSPILFWVSEKL